MPGPAGGGRSGGGGGIGGGARGGFSGGSHGGFSSGSHRSFTSGMHRPAGGFYRINANDNDPDQDNQGKGIGRAILIVVLLLMFGSPFISLVGNVISDFGSVVTVHTAVPEPFSEWKEEALTSDIGSAPRAKLDESLCTPVDVWYLDRCGLFSLSDELDEVKNALAYFYEKTGVQPFLVTTKSINGSLDPTWDEMETYLYDLYIELFSEDEGHYIFLYFMHEDDSYTLYYIPGWNAMDVMDDGASAILMDYIEWYYQESSSYGEMFASAFADAADAIMYVPEEYTSVDSANPDSAVLSTAPPASTAPAVESDSSEILTVPVVELTSDPVSVEIDSVEPESVVVESTTELVESTAATVDVTYYEEIEPDTEVVWDENFTEYTEEHYVSAEVLKYIAGGVVIFLAVVLFVVYFIWQKKKMRDLEDDM